MKPAPDYLKFILIVLAALIILALIAAVFAPQKTVSNQLVSNQLGSRSSDQTSDDLITGSVSYRPDGPTKPAVKDTDPAIGGAADASNATAKIKIFEFSSFGCALGKEVQTALKAVRQKYAGQIALVWKDLPLAEVYPSANLAHLAARCAQAQNQFWAYHDLLWQNQDDFSETNLLALAADLDLNTKDFKACLQDPATQKLIDEDILEADQLLIPGSPHLYINDQEILGRFNQEELEKIIAAELAKTAADASGQSSASGQKIK